MQPRDPADIVLVATGGAITQCAYTEIKARAGPIMPAQEALDPISLSARQTINGAIRPQRRKKDRTFRRGLENGRERVDRRIHVDHWLPRKEGAGHMTDHPRHMLKRRLAVPSLLRLLAAMIFKGRFGGLRLRREHIALAVVPLVRYRRGRHPIDPCQHRIEDRAALAVGVFVVTCAQLYDGQVVSGSFWRRPHLPSVSSDEALHRAGAADRRGRVRVLGAGL